MRQLVRQALRMRPDRIVVGEVRGAEVVDLLAALNTGHDGGAGTVHANSPAEVPATAGGARGAGGLDARGLAQSAGRRGPGAAYTSTAAATGSGGSPRSLCCTAPEHLSAARCVTAWHVDAGVGEGADALTAYCGSAIGDRNNLCCSLVGVRGVGGTHFASAQAEPGVDRAIRRCGQRQSGLMSAGGAALALGLLFATMGPFVAFAALLVGGTVLLRHRRRVARLRTAGDGRALEGALEVLVSELRVGTHPVRAFAIAAQETRRGRRSVVPCGGRARRTRCRRRRGLTGGRSRICPRRGLGAAGGVLAIGIRTRAGHLALMRAAQLDLAERQRFSSRVTAGMAGARATAAILAGLPLLGIALGELIGASPVAFLLGQGGGWFLVAGSVLVCAGLLWADRITERVLL